MKRIVAVSFAVLLLASCGGGKSATRLDELQRQNEDLTRRVKALEDDLLQADKKLIQHDQALQAMRDRIRQMEDAVNKMQLGPAPGR